MAKKSTTFAVMAKARAKYGKRLKDKDYQNLLACKSVAEIRTIQESILYSYQKDIAKHPHKNEIPKIHQVWSAIPNQLAKENKKFIYGVVREGGRAKDFETHFSYTFYIINRLLGCYTTLIEKQNSKGRADIIIETDNDIFIFEFKLDKSATEALEQIEEMQYALPYQDDKRKVHKIGVNISSTSRTVDEWVVVDMLG